jgi:hypothetical protein
MCSFVLSGFACLLFLPVVAFFNKKATGISGPVACRGSLGDKYGSGKRKKPRGLENARGRFTVLGMAKSEGTHSATVQARR